jgi:hypothetical protein
MASHWTRSTPSNAAGVTYSSDLPATTGALRSKIGGSSDAFVLKIGMGQESFGITGQVTNNLNNPLTGVAVSISGTFNRTVHTDAADNYSIGGLVPGGHFILSAQRGSFVFSPSSFEFPSLTQNETLDFSGPAPLVISGTIKDTAGNPISTSVSISGGATATVQRWNSAN